MNNFERLMAEGAYSCAGSLVYKNKEVGTLRDGDLTLNAAGREAIATLAAVTDVVAKPSRAKPRKAEPEISAEDTEATLDALLAE